MNLKLKPNRALTNSERNKLSETIQHMKDRGFMGWNTVKVYNFNVSLDEISLDINRFNQQTDTEFEGSIKGAIGKAIGRGLFKKR